jgi:hypothetical protein
MVRNFREFGLLIASSGMATSISFLRIVVMQARSRGGDAQGSAAG